MYWDKNTEFVRLRAFKMHLHVNVYHAKLQKLPVSGAALRCHPGAHLQSSPERSVVAKPSQPFQWGVALRQFVVRDAACLPVPLVDAE